MQRRYGDSYTLLHRAVELGSETETVHCLLSVLALQQRQWKLSQKRLSRIDARRFPYASLFLSVALHRLNKDPDADEKFEDFLERNPAPLFEASHP